MAEEFRMVMLSSMRSANIIRSNRLESGRGRGAVQTGYTSDSRGLRSDEPKVAGKEKSTWPGVSGINAKQRSQKYSPKNEATLLST